MARVNYKLISNKEAVPVFKHSLFLDKPNTRFATIYLGYGLYPDGRDRTLFLNYLRLRKNVYVDQTGMLSSDVALSDGSEEDDDDNRSAHIVVLENRGSGKIALLGCLRLILKTDEPQKLPIEDFYSEIFDNNPIPVNSVEASRFVSRADIGKDNYEIILSLFKMAMSYIDRHKVREAYGVIEEELERAMLKFGNFFERIAEPKMVKEYNDTNLGIKLNLDAMRDSFYKSGRYNYQEVFFWN